MCAAFQSTHPARGATRLSDHQASHQCYFNPRTPREVRRKAASCRISAENFNPRTPREVRPIFTCHRISPYKFQSTHPARGATGQQVKVRYAQTISIHAPRERCDRSGRSSLSCISYFNPRTPREVRRSRPCILAYSANFNPRTPREVRPYFLRS